MAPVPRPTRAPHGPTVARTIFFGQDRAVRGHRLRHEGLVTRPGEGELWTYSRRWPRTFG